MGLASVCDIYIMYADADPLLQGMSMVVIIYACVLQLVVTLRVCDPNRATESLLGGCWFISARGICRVPSHEHRAQGSRVGL